MSWLASAKWQANVNHRDEKTNTALHWAAKCGRHEDVTSLIKAPGIEIDARTKNDVTPLIYAADQGWDECVQLLLQAGALRTAKTNKGRTAHAAATRSLEKADAKDKPHYEKVLQLLQPSAADRTSAALSGSAPLKPVIGTTFSAAPAATDLADKTPAGAASSQTASFAAKPAMGGASPIVFAPAASCSGAPSALSSSTLAVAKPAQRAPNAGGEFAVGSVARASAHSQPLAPQTLLCAAKQAQEATMPSRGDSAALGGGICAAGTKGAPPKGHRSGRPTNTVRPADQGSRSLKPGVVLGADLQGILVDVSKWSGAAGPELGGAFTRLLDSRLQRIAELDQVVKDCATKLRRCSAAQEISHGVLESCEDELGELQSRKEGIHSKLQQLEAQQQAVLQPAVRLLQQHEPGPGPLMPLLLSELGRLKGTEEQLEQDVRRLERRLLALQADHWSKLTERVVHRGEVVRQQQLRVSALMEAASAAHVRAHSCVAALTAWPAGRSPLAAGGELAQVSGRDSKDEAPCLMRLRNQLRRRDAHDAEPEAVSAVDGAAHLSAPIAAAPATTVAVCGRRSMFATLASGTPTGTDAKLQGGALAGAAPAPLTAPVSIGLSSTSRGICVPGTSASQAFGRSPLVSAGSKSPSNNAPVCGLPNVESIVTGAVEKVAARDAIGPLFSTASEPTGLLSALSFAKTTDSVPATSHPKHSQVVAAPKHFDTCAEENIAPVTAAAPTPPLALFPVASPAATTPSPPEGAFGPLSNQNCATSTPAPAPTTLARSPAKQASIPLASGIKQAAASTSVALDAKDSPEECRLQWYRRHKPMGSGPTLLYGPVQPAPASSHAHLTSAPAGAERPSCEPSATPNPASCSSQLSGASVRPQM